MAQVPMSLLYKHITDPDTYTYISDLKNQKANIYNET